ncbi:hypothetical protein LguiA_011468 [Lonicera macranthoides]
MGFRAVNKVLQEIFPQVDSRLLRAVAIEHSKDADSAVEVVLVEIIPYLSQKSSPNSSPNENGSAINSSEVVVVDADTAAQNDDAAPVDAVGLNDSVNVIFYDANGVNEGARGDNTNDELISLEKCEESRNVSVDMSSSITVKTQGHENGADGDQDQVCGKSGGKEIISLDRCEENSNEVTGFDQCMPNAPESTPGSVDVLGMLNADLDKLEPSGTFVEDLPTKVVDLVEDVPVNTVVTRSGQIYSIDLIEEIIEDARSNKKTLLSAMESVISLMKEVELQEKAAVQAKEEAAQGGLDILHKVEELKMQLQLAKEANGMHAGEVYGEKAILATEVRELQTRLLSLSDKRDKSLAILDEMRHTLEVRLTAAEKEMKAAKQEKLEKEETARNLLNHQNGIMEKVVQESKILSEAAEENSKLRDFLIDRGHLVDILQGEIHVKCQDVKLLKQRFDERIPLGKFLSGSQSSSILASSSSSLKSTEPDQMPEVVAGSSENLKKSTTPSSESEFSSEDEKTSHGSDKLLTGGDDSSRVIAGAEDGWELFRNERGASGDDEGKVNSADDGWELFRNEKASGEYSKKALSEDGWELFDNRDYYK